MRMKIKHVKKLPAPVAWLLALVLRVWRWTLRVTVVDPEGHLRNSGEDNPVIYVAWHNRLVLLPAMAPKRLRRHTVVLASRSRDGGYISDLLRRFGVRTARGSSSKGGASGLMRLRQFLRDGDSVLLTPDGPRGPRYQMQGGAVWLAGQTDAPIVPLSLNAPKRWELTSWDGTQLPRPFSRVYFVVGHPVNVNGSDPEVFRDRVQWELMQITNDD